MMDHQSLAKAAPSPSQHRRFDLAVYAAVCLLLLADALRLIQSVAATTPTTAGLGADTLVVGMCFALLLAFGWLSWRHQGTSARLAFLIGATCGALFFASTIGSAILDPGSTEWLLRGDDWGTHYAGWAMFRNSPWTWPPGLLPTLMYPRGTAIVYTDSLPLLALLFKPLSPWLPDTFQYTGGWFAASCILQGGFAALLVQRWTRSAALTAASAALFLYAPILLNRLPHATLMAQWLILAALWLYFRPQPPRALLKEAWPWWVISGVSALVMPYLAMMVLAIFGAYWVRRSWVERERGIAQTAIAFFSTGLIVATLWWLSGALSLKFRNSNGGIVHGLYSFNLLGFFNSFGWSAVLPGIPLARPEQYEGYAYLGLGVICLLAVLLVESIARLRRPQVPRFHWPLLAVTLFLTAFAASTVLTLGPWTLINLPIETPLLSTFRSSGRFIWIAYYLVMLGAIVLPLKRFGHPTAILLVACAFGLQAWDFSQAHLYDANLRSGTGWPPALRPLLDPRWDQLAANRQHMVLVPVAACGAAPGPIMPFELLAARLSMTFNAAYVARWNPAAEVHYCQDLVDQLATGALSQDELYVVSDDWLARFGQNNHAITCEMLDGYRACTLATPAESVAQRSR